MAFPTDEQLAAAARFGSQAAWEDLVRHFQPILLRYLQIQTGDAELAADLMQETFLAALAHLDRLPIGHPFGAWLYRIAQHRLQRVWHRPERQRTVSLEALIEQGALGSSLPETAEPAAIVEAREMLGRVLGELAPPLRTALLLNSVEGFSAAEIAAILGISRTAAERRISRAKARFRVRDNELAGEKG